MAHYTNLQEQHADINFSLDCRFMQRGVVPRVPGIRVCPMGQQQGADFKVSKGAGIVKGNESTIVACMYVCTNRQEVLDCVTTSIA
jgi:hypothetical protein